MPRKGAPSNNPLGRPPGTRLIDHALLHIPPKDMVTAMAFSRAVMRCAQASDSLRLRAAEILMRYENAPPDRRVSMPIDLPKPTTAEIANQNIAELIGRVHRGELGVGEGTALIDMQNAAISAIEGTVLVTDFGVVERTIAANPVVVRTIVTTLPLSVYPWREAPTMPLPRVAGDCKNIHGEKTPTMPLPRVAGDCGGI
jgi:hypothetical protein